MCWANWSFLIAYCVVHNRKEEIGCKSNFCKQNFSKSNRIFVCYFSFTIHIELDLAQLFYQFKLVNKLSSRDWRCAMKLLPDFSYIQSRIWPSEAWVRLAPFFDLNFFVKSRPKLVKHSWAGGKILQKVTLLHNSCRPISRFDIHEVFPMKMPLYCNLTLVIDFWISQEV